MDSLKSLLDARKYELVIKLTEKASEPNDLFYRIAAFSCLGKYEDALFEIQDHQQILETRLEALIPVHIQLLCTLQRYEQAESVLDYYANLPYQSQIVEEILRKMPEIISSEEKKSQNKYYDDEFIIEKLNSKNVEEVLFALDLIKTRDIFTFLPEISKIMIHNPIQNVRSFALMLLVQKEVDRDLTFLSEGKILTVNPKKLPLPFTGANFNAVIRKMDATYKDPTLSQNGVQILSTYAIHIYPKEIPDDVDEIALAIYLIAKSYLGIEENIIEKCKQENLQFDKVNAYYSYISGILKGAY